MITIVRWLLLPISFAYWLAIRLRHLLYDKGWLRSQSFDIPTIVIGNLAVGGAGKSPMTEYLIQLLQTKYKIATLSRGYGRKTKGFRYVETNAEAIDVGDEPLQFKRKFPHVTVAVSEDRCRGIVALQSEHDVILLDDAFQHRKLRPVLAIVLLDFSSLFPPILTLPTGNFRDSFVSLKNADVILITKCPSIVLPKDKIRIEHKIRKYTTAPIFYSEIVYYDALQIESGQTTSLKHKDILLFTGIANSKPLVTYLQDRDNTVFEMPFADHHNYVSSDYQKVKSKFDNILSANKIILTTEKDVQRIDLKEFRDYPLHYIPIQMVFMEGGADAFAKIVEQYIHEVI